MENRRRSLLKLAAGCLVGLVIAWLAYRLWVQSPQIHSLWSEDSGSNSPSSGAPAEYRVVVIPLAGEAAEPAAEISGLAWYGDWLILLPQYPSRFSKPGEGSLFGLSEEQLRGFLEGTSREPITPRTIPLSMGGIEEQIDGFEGFEAITFHGDQFYLTSEARGSQGMMGYLVAGQISPDLSQARLEAESLVENVPQLNRDNHSDEALLVFNDRIYTLYELNGRQINQAPKATLFDLSLRQIEKIPFPNVEYRITEAAQPDESGRFWAINYFFPGDSDLKSEGDLLATPPGGADSSHGRSEAVERLVELQITPGIILLTDRAPIYLELLPDGTARNWEGLAYWPGKGFLLATDKYPETILGFVEFP